MGVTRTFTVIFAFLISVFIILPLLSIILVPFLILRFTVQILAKLFKRKSLGGMLSPKDSFFVVLEPNMKEPVVIRINVIVKMKGQVGRETIQQYFSSLVFARETNGSLSYERLQQYVTIWMGFPFFAWVQDFKLEHQLNFMDNLDKSLNEDSLMEFISALSEKHFIPKRALWDATVVQNFGSASDTVMIIRFQHAIGDGYSMLKLFTSGLGLVEGAILLPVKNDLDISLKHKLTLLYNSSIEFPFRFCQSLLQGIQTKRLRGIPRLVSPTKTLLYSTTTAIPIQRMKEAKRRFGVPFMNILVAAISKALTNHFVRDEELSISLTAHLPFKKSIIGLGNQLQNKFHHARLQLELGPRSTMEQLDYIKSIMESEAKSYFQNPTQYSIRIFGLLPACIYKILLLAGLPRGDMTLISNIPGPPSPVSFYGHEIQDIMFCNVGIQPISFWILSYNNQVKIVVASNTSVVRDQVELASICREIEGEFENIFQC